jgi:hypothetical protein
VSGPDEVRAAVHRIERALSNHSGGVDSYWARTEIGREIQTIERHIDFAEFEITNLRNSERKLYGRTRPRLDVERETWLARSHCASLRAKADQLRHRDELKGE